MEGKEINTKPPLALADASAGCIAAILLFLVQKFPDGSDAKHLCMYLSPVLAIILNNIIGISIRYVSFHYRRRLLKSRYKDLAAQRSEYMKADHTDIDVMNEYNKEIKKTHLAMISTSLVDLGAEPTAKKPKRTAPAQNNTLPPA